MTSRPVHDLIDGYVAQANKQLERWETIKRFEILASELTVDEGEVTPSLKIRRSAGREEIPADPGQPVRLRLAPPRRGQSFGPPAT